MSEITKQTGPTLPLRGVGGTPTREEAVKAFESITPNCHRIERLVIFQERIFAVLDTANGPERLKKIDKIIVLGRGLDQIVKQFEELLKPY